MHILVVENNLVLAHAAERILSRELDAEVLLLYRGRQVVSSMGHRAFDAMVVGWNLDDCDVLELIATVRQKHTHLPIILCSDRSDAEALLSAVEAGVSDYLLKPYSPRALLTKVKKALGKRRDRYRHNRLTDRQPADGSRDEDSVDGSPASED